MDIEKTLDKETLKPVTMYETTAKLLNHLLNAVSARFGEEGRNVLIEGVKVLTEEQGVELAQSLNILKEELDQSNVFFYETFLDSKQIELTFNNYTKAQERAGIESITMFSIMAKLFAQVSKAVVDCFGEEGREVIMEAVRTFGEERGRNIAKRAAMAGEPNEIDHYLSNYDMGRSELFQYETLFHPKEIEQTFTKCAFAEQWIKDGMQEYGILYCQMIDPAIAKGFNRNFEVVHDQYILKEGVCHFRFQMKKEEIKN
ncbi:L-2-amino-thiazoline-4-carboxylic acid hydrolase [Neobacillus sp. NPDC093182]|uniref:L-2-amino-thiazoline-4-carboxylic acid hydrolase n=1 Tax=Neobacillus sp. NPDC093182 TaxID=3364297 RepID=UPI0037FC0766